jgi:3-carboxy-cis,cis-muconate cycloisomerase
MRPSSSSSEPCASSSEPVSSSSAPGLFDGVLAAGRVRPAVADEAWLRAMLDAEAALAVAAARVGLIAPGDAAAIAAACAQLSPPAAEIGAEAASSGTPVVPLVKRLRAAVPESAAPAVHLGATSQDIVDTAAMLVASRALPPLCADLGAAAGSAARLAREHRRTAVAGRTLLQHAMPTSFGLVAAGWLSGLDRARRRLAQIRPVVQLGGAVGTLSRYGDQGVALLSAYAAELGLAEPELPWHTERTRIAELAGALGGAAGAVGTVARDVILSAQTEIGELTEGGGEGGSSAMPHKHNPIRAIAAAASAAQAPGLVATLLSVMPQEHQRAAGNWYAEWRPLIALFESTGSAAYQLRRSLERLEVHADRMRDNLDRSPDLGDRDPGDGDRGDGDRDLGDGDGGDRDLGDSGDRHPGDEHLGDRDLADIDLGSADALIDRALAAAAR